MKFNAAGLVIDDQGNQVLYIPWRHVHGLWVWMIIEEKPFQRYPGYNFTRKQVAFILTHYYLDGENDETSKR